MGYIDKNGNEVIPCKYSNVGDFSEGYAAVENKKWGYIDKDGSEVIPFIYEQAREFHDGLAFVQFLKKDLTARYSCFISKDGKKNSVETYKEATDFKDGYAVVTTMNLSPVCCIVDKNYNNCFIGQYILRDDDIAFSIDCHNNAYIYDMKNKKMLNSKKITKGYSFINFSNGMIRIKYKQKYGFLDANLKKVIPCMYEEATPFIEDVSIVKFDEDTIGIIDKQGKSILFNKDEEYQEIYNFSEGLACVKNQTGLYGYINKLGKEVIPCIYTAADDFSEGLAGVIDQDNNLFYIDKQGTKVLKIPKIYNSVLDLGDRKIPISAYSQEELASKKIELLKKVKEELINDVTTNIDNLTNEIVKSKK